MNDLVYFKIPHIKLLNSYSTSKLGDKEWAWVSVFKVLILSILSHNVSGLNYHSKKLVTHTVKQGTLQGFLFIYKKDLPVP